MDPKVSKVVSQVLKRGDPGKIGRDGRPWSWSKGFYAGSFEPTDIGEAWWMNKSAPKNKSDEAAFKMSSTAVIVATKITRPPIYHTDSKVQSTKITLELDAPSARFFSDALLDLSRKMPSITTLANTPISRAVKLDPDLVERYLGGEVSPADMISAALAANKKLRIKGLDVSDPSAPTLTLNVAADVQMYEIDGKTGEIHVIGKLDDFSAACKRVERVYLVSTMTYRKLVNEDAYALTMYVETLAFERGEELDSDSDDVVALARALAALGGADETAAATRVMTDSGVSGFAESVKPTSPAVFDPKTGRFSTGGVGSIKRPFLVDTSDESAPTVASVVFQRLQGEGEVAKHLDLVFGPEAVTGLEAVIQEASVDAFRAVRGETREVDQALFDDMFEAMHAKTFTVPLYRNDGGVVTVGPRLRVTARDTIVYVLSADGSIRVVAVDWADGGALPEGLGVGSRVLAAGVWVFPWCIVDDGVEDEASRFKAGTTATASFVVFAGEGVEHAGSASPDEGGAPKRARSASPDEGGAPKRARSASPDAGGDAGPEPGSAEPTKLDAAGVDVGERDARLFF